MIAVRWLAIALTALAAIIIPFVLFGDNIEAWAAQVLSPEQNNWLIATIVVALLASDVFLPVPSSLVSTSAGALLGLPLGLAASTLGMSLGCALGYGFGRHLGRPLLRRFVGESEIRAVERQFAVYGAWAVALFRPVPVLAEASVLFAGAVRTRPLSFALATTGMNVAVSAVYCATGAFASSTGSWIAAFVVLLTVSTIAFTGGRRLISSGRSGSVTQTAPVPERSRVVGPGGGGRQQTGCETGPE